MKLKFSQLPLDQKIIAVKRKLQHLELELFRQQRLDRKIHLRRRIAKGKELLQRLQNIQSKPDNSNKTPCPVCHGKTTTATKSYFFYGRRLSGQEGDCLTCLGTGWIK